MTSSRRGINDYFDEEGSLSNSNSLPEDLLEGNFFYSSDTSALLAVTDQEDESGSAMKVIVPQTALQKHVPGPRPKFQKQFPSQGLESPKVANEMDMADAENPPEEPVSRVSNPQYQHPRTLKKSVTKLGAVLVKTEPNGLMEACARCGSLDHCVSFCPRLTWNGKKPVKIKDLYFFLVTSRQGLPPAISEVDPRVIDRERWEKEVEYPQTPALARHRREGVLNGTLPGRLDLNLWNELDVNTGLSLGLQIHPDHVPGGQHRCCDAVWYHPSQTQENTGSTSQAEQPSRKSKAGKYTTDSVLHGTMGGRIAKIPRRETQARGGDRGGEESDRGGGFGHGREAAPRGSGNFDGFDQTQRPHLPSLSSQKKFDFLLGEFDRQQTRERHNMLNRFEATQKERHSIFVSEIIDRIQGTFGEVRGATSGLDADLRRGENHGLEYPGHLPSHSGSDAPVNRHHLRRGSLTPERLTHGLQSGNQAHGQDAYTLPAGTQSFASRLRDIPHQNRENPGGAPNQQ
ncbi:uncharacterized protein EAE97_010294 [Botrytis byssoidea]|uniref:Uncharacterized protein n=1 Tax=Botrytis byssoidea TaxID=139641 RepID=A0A9P5LNE7_9HELO|nr:uncharacterized protein EAE97_010294 [Botrytis byssoidea]KAF7925994.1 hypothetical protein EAE97_010294 [Botrytis byssoidea]